MFSFALVKNRLAHLESPEYDFLPDKQMLAINGHSFSPKKKALLHKLVGWDRVQRPSHHILTCPPSADRTNAEGLGSCLMSPLSSDLQLLESTSLLPVFTEKRMGSPGMLGTCSF